MIQLIAALGSVIFCAVAVAYAASVWIKKERAEKELHSHAVRVAEEAIRKAQDSRHNANGILEIKLPKKVRELAVK